jgi:CBS domain-containing protein
MYRTVEALLGAKGRSVFSVAPGVTVYDAVSTMNQHDIGSILVTENERLLGIFTERDVLRRIVGAGVDPARTLVAQVMTPNPVTIPPYITLQEVVDIVEEKRCRHLPVMVGSRVQAMVSLRDVTRWVAESHREEAAHLKSYIAGG